MVLEEHAGNGADPAHVAVFGIRLIDADDADLALLASLIGIEHRGAEENLIGFRVRGRIHHLSGLDSLVEESNPAVDFAKALLAVEIVAVFRPVAVARRPGDDVHHLRALNVDEMLALIKEAPVAGRRHVVLRIGRESGELHLVVIIFGHESGPSGMRFCGKANPTRVGALRAAINAEYRADMVIRNVLTFRDAGPSIK